MSIQMFLVGVGSQTTVDSGYHKPDDTGPFLLCVVAAVIFIALVAVAAAIANYRDARRAERGRRRTVDEAPTHAG